MAGVAAEAVGVEVVIAACLGERLSLLNTHSTQRSTMCSQMQILGTFLETRDSSILHFIMFLLLGGAEEAVNILTYFHLMFLLLCHAFNYVHSPACMSLQSTTDVYKPDPAFIYLY